jgi:two-component system, LytTR family, response regulator
MRKIKAILVDDEIDACENLKDLILEFTNDEIEIVAIIHSTQGAENLIAKYKPDVVFMDIEMPKENAFQFLDRIKPIAFEVIFITAYDNYAITALRLNAVDYILKPVAITELQDAVLKLKEKLSTKQQFALNNGWYNHLSNLFAQKTKFKSIVLKEQNNIEMVDLDRIYYLEALAGYTKFVYTKENSKQKNITTCHSIAEYEEMLVGMPFYRVHKSYIVNIANIDRILSTEQTLILKNGTKLPISRRRFVEFMSFMKTIVS